MRRTPVVATLFLIVMLLVTACQPAAATGPAVTSAPVATAPAATSAPVAPATTTVPAASSGTAAPATAASAATSAPVASGTAAPAVAQGKPGGTLNIALPTIPSLDINSVNNVNMNEYAQLYYETLVDRDASGKVVPLLIKEIQQSPDGLVHTWKLQPNVKFHDGTDFNADAVKFNLDRKINNWGPLGDMIPFDKIEVVDPLTVKATLKRPYPGIYNVLAVKTFSMYSPTFVQKAGDEGMKTQEAGTGPFTVDQFSPNDVLRLKKDPNYWQKGLPYLDAVVMHVVPDAQTRATQLEAGDVDVAIQLGFQDLQRIKSNSNINVLTGTSSRQYYVNVNNTHPPLDDLMVRQALNLAMDRDGIIKNVFLGFATPAQAFLDNPAVDPFIPAGKWDYDPDKARQLLDQAGWKVGSDGIRAKDGKKLVLKELTRKGAVAGDYDIAVLVQGLLKDVGIQVDVEVVDNATLLAQLNKPVNEMPYYDLVPLAWGTFTGDADYFMTSYYRCDAWPPKGYDYSLYCNKEVDKLIDQSYVAPTLDARNDLYGQAIKMVWNDAPTIPLVDSVSAVATRKNVKGIYLDAAQTIWPAKWVWLDE